MPRLGATAGMRAEFGSAAAACRCCRSRDRAPASAAGAVLRAWNAAWPARRSGGAPPSSTMRLRFDDTYSSASGQSTSRHCAGFACSIGFVRRSSRVDRFVREAVLVGQPALVDALVLERHDAQHATLRDLHDQVGAEPVVRADRLATRHLPGAGLFRNGFDSSAPTGQMSIMLPDSSESTVLPTKVVISERSPRLTMPSSMMPATSWPKRTQRVHWMQRVMPSVEISGPMSLRLMTRAFLPGSASWSRRNRPRCPAAGTRRPGRRSGSRADD